MKPQSTQKEGHKALRAFLEKVVVDVGVGRQSNLPSFGEKILPQVSRDIGLITGQKPQPRPAKESIAGFKVREGQIVGLRITLRRARMVDFFERLIKIVLPRVRDFTGIDQHAVDPHGVLNIGIKEQFVFPEVSPEQSPVSFSMGISIVPRLRDRKKSLETFREIGMPFKKK